MGKGFMDPLMLLGLAYLFLQGDSKKGLAAPSENPHQPPTVPESQYQAEKDGAALYKRANQPRALAWQTFFEQSGRPSSLAEALSRWTGIESAGNPLAVSRLGERGLLQCLESTALAAGGPFSRAEWDSLVDSNTKPEEHARLALQEYDWLWNRAAKQISESPTDETDHVWYAKLLHQRPMDFRDVRMYGKALDMATELARQWDGRPTAMHRLRTASVVAWNDPSPWERHV